jgi:phosphoribosylanthranilate isomerase
MSVLAKICGLSSEEGVEAALAGGAAYLGFVFYPGSPRAVGADRVARLAARVPKGVCRVGLFVDAADETIALILDEAPLDLLQLHGRESPARVEEVKRRFALPVMKAIRVGGEEDLLAAERFEEVADLLLFDAKPPPGALPGGNGLLFDWALLAGRSWRRPWMLSGGLDAALLPQAVKVSGARLVDVSSGVEAAPGRKDPAKIRAFLAAAHGL